MRSGWPLSRVLTAVVLPALAVPGGIVGAWALLLTFGGL